MKDTHFGITNIEEFPMFGNVKNAYVNSEHYEAQSNVSIGTLTDPNVGNSSMFAILIWVMSSSRQIKCGRRCIHRF